LKTPLQILNSGRKYLQEKGVEAPFVNAEILLSFILKKEKPYLYSEKKHVDKETIDRYFSLLDIRVKGMPLQYITGEIFFYGYNFFLTEGVFIPRPETEILVKKVLEIYQSGFSPEPIKILDLCTGCGNIAVTLAMEIGSCKICAIDISKKALESAGKNAAFHGTNKKVTLLQSDLFGVLKNTDEKFHMIVSNPPYVSSRDMAKLDCEVKKEPALALNGGKDGLEVMEKILLHGGDFLCPGGYICMEIGYDQSEKIENRNYRNIKLAGMEKDFANIKRVAVFRKEPECQKKVNR
jgi:release factor glutamine methyltransferase